MLSLATLLVVVLASLIVTRVATVVLTLTGLSKESARFQARSALTGVGFTTNEAESVVNHPIRRRVVMALMLIGSAGVITAIATLLLSFAEAGRREAGFRLLVLVGGLLALFLVARSRLVDRALSRLIARALARWTDLDARDYAALLHLSGDYAVMEIFVEPGDWTEGRPIVELAPWDEGIRILGIVRPDGRFVGAPVGATLIHEGDTLVAYGRSERLCELDRRKAGPDGDAAHRRAVEEQGAIVAREREAPARRAASPPEPERVAP